MFTEETAVFMADFGVQATAGASSGRVILDRPDELIVAGQGHSHAYQITYRLADFPSMTTGTSITVDGVAYQVTEPPRAIDDGVFMMASLQRP